MTNYLFFLEKMNKLKEFDELFPYVNEEERDPANARRHADFLWQQLDHLGYAFRTLLLCYVP